MRTYLISLGAGLLVGIVYSLLNVRSPAPPVVALVGLLGILLGEQIIPLAKHMLQGSRLAAAWRPSQCTPHIFGPNSAAGSGRDSARRGCKCHPKGARGESRVSVGSSASRSIRLAAQERGRQLVAKE